MTPERLAIKQAVAATRKHMEQQTYSLPKFRPLRKFIRGLYWNLREENRLRSELRR